jgi:SAM-dependent methyltransferase
MNAEEANPFSEPALVDGYEAWYEGPGQRAERLEKELLMHLLHWIGDGQNILDVGFGTGHFARFFNHLGLQVVGLDISLPMVCEATRLGSPPVILGDALQLPFDDRSFDIVTIVTTLEFVASPTQVIRESVRVGRRGLLIGALNRASRLGRSIRSVADEPWRSAKLMTVPELRWRLEAACEDRQHALRWLTTLWPGLSRALRLPWGDFIGMAIRWERHPGEEQSQ